MNGPYIAFSQSAGLGTLIRKFTGGDVNHCLFIFRDDVFNTWLTLGANLNGLTIETLATFSDKIIDIWEPKEGSFSVGLQKYAYLLNTPYDVSGLIGMSVVEVAERIAHLRIHNPFLNDKELFCSEFGKMVCVASSYNVGDMLPGSTDPNELDTAIKISDLFNYITTLPL